MRLRSKPEVPVLALLAYGPFLLSSPGQVSADSKQDLYLDPGGFLSRAAHLWDPHVGAGTVPHQNLGYLFPTGPWYWCLDRLGVPDWVAQRLWLGTLALVAALGARWLFDRLGAGRVGAGVGALVYLFTPYQLAFTARMSVLLLPWAALPWIVGLTMRAVRERGWRPAALLALVVLGAGGINASSLLLVGLAPVVWVALEVGRGSVTVRRAAVGMAKAGVLALGVSLWWVVGLRLQGRYGLPVLQLTENVRTVALASEPSDVLRGLGNWFFYGRDRVGWSVDQAAAYAGADDLVVVLSYLIPMASIAAACVMRWAHRRYFVLLVTLGTIVAAGSWPPDDPRPYGSLWNTLTTNTSVGLAFRNSPRVVPIVALGLAGLLAGAVGAISPRGWRALGGGAVAGLATLGLLPVWQTGFLTDSMTRPQEVPRYWREAASAIDAGPQSTRVLEVPGSSFAAYRWGTTVDPITPALIERPYLAREILPMGGRATANLLDALDHRMQIGTFEASSLAPVARLFGVGTVVLRADLDRSGRFDTPAPGPLWAALRDGPGLGPPRSFGPPGGDGVDDAMPSVALFDISDPRPILRTAPPGAAIVLAGDGDGIVDAAAAGLVDGRVLLRASAALTDAQLEAALHDGAHLIVTDTNRRRAKTWFYTLRDDRGETERPGAIAPDPTGYDFRLDPFPGSTDDARTVVQQQGGSVWASMAGGPERPEHRAAMAVDGDPSTAWRVGGVAAIGARLEVRFDAPVATSDLRLVQASSPGGRRVARVRIELDGSPAVEVDLGPASLQAPGQLVPILGGDVQNLRVTLLSTTSAAPGGDAGAPVGLAEVRVGVVTIDEVVRPPIDLLARVGHDLAGHGLDVVLTRSRVEVGVDRSDDETHLDRRLDLPIARTFALVGLARPHAGSSASVQDTTTCRGDLLQLDGVPVPIRLANAADGRHLEACAPVSLAAGEHRLTAARGSQTGWDLDRLVLSSDSDGLPAAAAARGASSGSGAALELRRQTDTRQELTVETDGEPFWLILGQSLSDGWHLDVAGAEVGPRQLVDGYANGWLVTPQRSGTLSATLEWEPQRLVWVGMVMSVAVLAVCLAILWRTRRRSVPDDGLSAVPTLHIVRDGSGGLDRPAYGWLAGVGVVGVLVAPPGIAAGAVAVLAIAWALRAGPSGLALLLPGVLLVSRVSHRPSLAWLVVLVLAGDALRRNRDAPRVSR